MTEARPIDDPDGLLAQVAWVQRLARQFARDPARQEDWAQSTPLAAPSQPLGSKICACSPPTSRASR